MGRKLEESIITQANPATTFNNVWPAIIFANNRTDKLIGLTKYDTNSIGTKIKDNSKEEPEGKKSDNALYLCSQIQMQFIPKKVITASEKDTLK